MYMPLYNRAQYELLTATYMAWKEEEARVYFISKLDFTLSFAGSMRIHMILSLVQYQILYLMMSLLLLQALRKIW